MAVGSENPKGHGQEPGSTHPPDWQDEGSHPKRLAAQARGSLGSSSAAVDDGLELAEKRRYATSALRQTRLTHPRVQARPFRQIGRVGRRARLVVGGDRRGGPESPELGHFGGCPLALSRKCIDRREHGVRRRNAGPLADGALRELVGLRIFAAHQCGFGRVQIGGGEPGSVGSIQYRDARRFRPFVRVRLGKFRACRRAAARAAGLRDRVRRCVLCKVMFHLPVERVDAEFNYDKAFQPGARKGR